MRPFLAVFVFFIAFGLTDWLGTHMPASGGWVIMGGIVFALVAALVALGKAAHR